MMNQDERLSKAVERMNKMSISELRQVARALGISRPAVGKKERLITETVALAKGELAPVPLSTRGAPPKSDNFDRELYAEIMEIRQSYLNLTEPEMMFVNDSVEALGSAGVYIGLLYKRADGFVLKGLSGGEIGIHESVVNKFALRTGDKVKAECILNDCGEVEASEVISVNGELYGKVVNRPEFSCLSRIYAQNAISLGENGGVALKMTDCFAPLAYGQRILALTDDRRVSTELAKNIVNSLLKQNCAQVSAAFIGCTPEDKVSVSRSVKHDALFFAEFDWDKHEQLFELTLAAEYAKRQAELGKDAVLVIDGFFRPAKSFNQVDAEAGAELKKILACAGAFEEGGSLTVIALSDISDSNNADGALIAEFTDFENAVLRFTTFKDQTILNYKASRSDFACNSQTEAQALKQKPVEEVFKIFSKD